MRKFKLNLLAQLLYCVKFYTKITIKLDCDFVKSLLKTGVR